MTLAMRLMLAIGLVTSTATVALGVTVREAWRRTEERRFDEAFAAATARLQREVEREIVDLPRLMAPLCDHDPVIDGVLVDLRAGRLEPSRRLAIQLRVPEMMKALGLDELTLLTRRGEILGSGHDRSAVATRDAALAKRLERRQDEAVARTGAPPAVEAHCIRRLESHGVGLVGARHLTTLLDEVGRAQGVELSLGDASPGGDDIMTQAVRLDRLAGLPIVASRSRVPLRRALSELDRTVLPIALTTIGLSLIVAWLLARGLSRPIVALSAQARRVVSGAPEPVRGGGGRELVELAESFNRALSDLAALRERLSRTERIAARREIARRVAHEVKNPLMPIRTAIETLRRLRARGDPAFDEYFDEASKTVLDEVARIARIVQEFTEFERLPAPQPAFIDLSDATKDVVRLHAGMGTPIEVELDPVPEVRADRAQVVQVLTNLLQNALDATRGASNARVIVALRALDAAHVALTVQDNGPGVPREHRDRLFEPYQTTKEHGTGLGLAIAQRIAFEHGGDVTYRDADGGGAQFTVTLPVAGPTLLGQAPSSTRRATS